MTLPAIMHACTGHRPDKLGGYDIEVQTRLVDLAMWQLQRDRPDVAISGMALGWDLAWAVAAIKLGVPVLAYVPFDGHHEIWPEAAQKKYKAILAKCWQVIYVATPGFTNGKMKRRNEAMVTRIGPQGKVIALWDGSQGGTWHCVQFAIAMNRTLVNLWDEYRELALQ